MFTTLQIRELLNIIIEHLFLLLLRGTVSIQSGNRVKSILSRWLADPSIGPNIMNHAVQSTSPPVIVDLPEELDPSVKTAVNQAGYQTLYRHQAECYDTLLSGASIAVVTGTASGKSMCYNLTVMDEAVKRPQMTAMYLFPTRALTQDQFGKIKDLSLRVHQASDEKFDLSPAIYDGDTPTNHRSAIRSTARILLTNPDMLHTGILPHHTLWERFFRNLGFIVIDEMHTYRGVFGSHVANVIRRIKRVAAFYGSNPQFILTSATIANPKDLAERLTETQVEVIQVDYSPKGEKHLLIYNPPIINNELGLRKGAISESINIAGSLLDYGIQTLIFARSRRSVEIALRQLQNTTMLDKDSLRGYRSGYLPSERRAIESDLRSGKARVVVATNALELGIDIGGIEAVLLVGYPGSISAARQQIGRAGRRDASSIAIFLATSNPLDQFIARNPEFLTSGTPEQALINPDNLLILLQHLRCAAFELPFNKHDHFGSLEPDLLDDLLSYLDANGVIKESRDRYYWTSTNYPSQEVSLRSTSANSVQLIDETTTPVTIGDIDSASASWMVHPQAVYLHEGRSYLVNQFDQETNKVYLKKIEDDYYTEPKLEVQIQVLSEHKQRNIIDAKIVYGEVLVTSKLIGFRKIRWYTQEKLAEIPLEQPPTQMQTVATWLVLEESLVNMLRQQRLWTNDPNQYGKDWEKIRRNIRHRDRYTCQVCGLVENGSEHHVHHKIPFRQFEDAMIANRYENLITLCPVCHQKVELTVKMRSGVAGLGYVFQHLAPVLLMCDISDLGLSAEPQSSIAQKQPAVVIYDQVPAGIGLSETLFSRYEELFHYASDLIDHCTCADGCPACVGPAAENGIGGKITTRAILKGLTGK